MEGSSHHHICRGTARRESTRNSSNRGKHERFDGLHVSPLANPQLNNNKKCATTTTPPPRTPLSDHAYSSSFIHGPWDRFQMLAGDGLEWNGALQ